MSAPMLGRPRETPCENLCETCAQLRAQPAPYPCHPSGLATDRTDA